jgi:NhaP-type Na+/H+ or K+/H+ antiporter
VDDSILPSLTGIVVLGFAAQWVAWRLRIPAILLLLLAGLAVGPGLEVLEPDEVFGDLLFPFVSASVALVLFEGGTSLDLHDLRRHGRVIPLLITIGGCVSWALLGVLAALLLDVDAGIAALLGAILLVTGPTVIGPLLQQVRPTERVASVLRWEGVLIDPLGAIFAVLVFEGVIAAEGGASPSVILRGVAEALGVGALIGLGAAGAMTLLLRRYLLPDFLHQIATLAAVLGAFTLAEEVHEESGLVAAIVMGVALASQRVTPVAHIVDFNEAVRVLSISVLFVVLAARIERDDLAVLGWREVAYVALAIVLVRPAAVALATLSSKLSRNERVFVAAVAPRGIVAASVSSVFAIRLADVGVEGAGVIVPVTFLLILTTIVVYSSIARPLARRLDVAEPEADGVVIVGAHRWARSIARALRDAGAEVLLVDTDAFNVAAARYDGLRAYHGNVLGDRSLADVDLSGLGRLVALTSNDEANALAAQRFVNLFGRRDVYQLLPATTEKDVEDVSPHLRGRLLFGEGATFRELSRRFAAGASIVSAEVDGEGLDRFRSEHPEGVPLFLVADGGAAQPFSTDGTPRGKGKLVALVGP